MTTLKPEEAWKLANEAFIGPAYNARVYALACAIEAELRRRWFAEPAAYLSTDPKSWGGSRIRPQGTFTVPVYAAPKDQEPKA
jgi:hypothetical protein